MTGTGSPAGAAGSPAGAAGSAGGPIGGSTGGWVLVAGIGNLFFGDDGFGPAVVERLGAASLPDGVDVADYGIAGVHLAYDLLEGRHRCLVMVDAVPMGEPPGTLSVLEVGDVAGSGDRLDAHAMSPAVVLAALSGLGGSVRRVLVVGCQPSSVEPGMGLSAPVAAAVEPAVRLVEEVVAGEVGVLRRRRREEVG